MVIRIERILYDRNKSLNKHFKFIAYKKDTHFDDSIKINYQRIFFPFCSYKIFA